MFRRRRWPLVVAAVGVLAAVALAVFLLRGDGSGGPPRATGSADPDIVETGEPVPDATLEPVAFESLLAAPARYVDRQVTASLVPVQSHVGPDAIWVGASAESRVLVVLLVADPPFGAALEQVSFTGVVRRGSPEFGTALGLTGADLAQFRRQGSYVEIESFEPA